MIAEVDNAHGPNRWRWEALFSGYRFGGSITADECPIEYFKADAQRCLEGLGHTDEPIEFVDSTRERLDQMRSWDRIEAQGNQ